MSLASFSFILRMVSEKKNFEYFFSKIYPLYRPSTNKLSDLHKSRMKRGGLLNKHFCKKISNIPNDSAESVNFHFSHYKSMEIISCQSNQSSYPTRIKNFSFPLPVDAICVIWKEWPSRLQRRCHLKMLTDGRIPDACI